ncbi:MAG: tetratricopeptide repeat protein [Verrucomicrobiota bacterium]
MLKKTKSAILGFASLLTWTSHCLAESESALTLQEALAKGQAALAAGDYSGAFEVFEIIDEEFGSEPELATKVSQITLLPLHGYSALMGGQTEKAVSLFEGFIEKYPEDQSRVSFVVFNLARAHTEQGDIDQAIETYKEFVALNPARAEAALATLEAVRLMFESSRNDEALDTLDKLYQSQRNGALRSKARLFALQKSLELGLQDRAKDYILNSEWSIQDMPELAVLAFAALKLGSKLLESGDYDDAIACYRLVPPYDELVKGQARRLQEVRARFESRRMSVGLYQGGQFWTLFYRRLIAQLEAQLEGLQQAEDYTAGLYQAFGQAYLLANRPREAWIIFESLARNPELSEREQSEAHYRWILAAIEVGVWEDAYKIAKGFSKRFPDSPLVPDALYLLGSTYQEAKEYPKSIEVFTTFLENHQDHRLAARTLFLRGFNHNYMNDPIQARMDFENFIASYPDNDLFEEARLWRALTFFTERNYDTAFMALDELAQSVKSDRLEPEIAYHKAATLYAKRDYESALTAINDYLKAYPLHTRIDQARVLLGDIEMGRGELATARGIFMDISPEAGHLFVYSVFQAGKILRAVAGAAEDPEVRERFLETHIEHFQKYLDREDVVRKDRISEALYWIGWTHTERSSEELARAVFKQALDLYGDDLDSGEVPTIIDAYARIEKRLSQLSRKEREEALKAWIDEARAAALEDDRLTYFSRLSFYLQSMLPPEDPASFIFEVIEQVPIERIDAEGLGRIASELVDRYPRVSEDYLERLEDEYPDSLHRSYAYFARARLHLQEGKYEDARIQLARFRAETPLHPLSTKVTLDYAEALTETAKYEEAETVLEDLLKLRTAKGRPHAKALIALSRNAESAGNIKRAIPYAQRVYNVYRAYPELAAEAYWMSALHFEQLGDPLVAYRTLDEMLSNPAITKLPIAEQAETKRDSLYAALPSGALDETAEEMIGVGPESVE